MRDPSSIVKSSSSSQIAASDSPPPPSSSSALPAVECYIRVLATGYWPACSPLTVTLPKVPLSLPSPTCTFFPASSSCSACFTCFTLSFCSFAAGLSCSSPACSHLSFIFFSAHFTFFLLTFASLTFQELELHKARFTAFYSEHYQGRRLVWNQALDRCVLTARFSRGKKELEVSLFQAVVLMVFNRNAAQPLSLLDLAEETKLDMGRFLSLLSTYHFFLFSFLNSFLLFAFLISFPLFLSF